MKKIKYFFNPHTLRFEKVETSLTKKILRVLGYLGKSFLLGIVIVLIIFNYFDSPKIKYLEFQNEIYSQSYILLKDKISKLNVMMNDLEDRDNYIYKAQFNAFPLPDSVRAKEIEKSNKVKLFEPTSQSDLIRNMTNQLNNLNLRMVYQQESFEEISDQLKNKEKLILATPSIQPLSNRRLIKLSSGFGYRFHSILKIYRPHYGLDFSAPIGTPIYATADGKVVTAGLNSGFGLYVVIYHGFGYETLYGHMNKINVQQGQQVKRGHIIGFVGNTGLSSGPHLHYEVHKNSHYQNPIYYFFNDLKQSEYDRMIQESNSSKESLD